MASSYYKLDVTNREEFRSRGARRLRRKGLIPGVLYYSGEETVNISIERSILFHAMQSGQRIFEIDQDGESQYTMIKQLQYHPVTDEIIHVDLMRVRRSEKITIAVPLLLTGEPVGVKEGGVLSQSLNQVEISCLPTNVPENIEVDIENLELGQSLSVGDIKVKDEEVELLTASDINILTIQAPGGGDDDIEEEEKEDEDGGELNPESENSDQENNNNEGS